MEEKWQQIIDKEILLLLKKIFIICINNKNSWYPINH